MITVFHLVLNAASVGSELRAQNELSRSWLLLRSDDKAAIAEFFKALKDGPRNGLELRPVATLEGTDLEVAFEKTNHIDAPWTSRPTAGMRVLSPQARSTSVGDLMVSGDVAHVVMPMGYLTIEWREGQTQTMTQDEDEIQEVEPRVRERMTAG